MSSVQKTIPWKPRNPLIEAAIILALAKSPNKTASYGQLWTACKRVKTQSTPGSDSTQTIGGKTTFTLYLRSLERKGIITSQRLSRKNVTLRLNPMHPTSKDLEGYLRPQSAFRRDVLVELSTLKGEDRRIRSAEIMSKTMQSFEAQLLDIISQRAQRVEVRRPDPITDSYERRTLQQLPEILASQLVSLYLADPAFAFAMMHVLMQPRSEIDFSRKGKPRLYDCASDWLRKELRGSDFDALNKSWRRSKLRSKRQPRQNKLGTIGALISEVKHGTS